MTPLFAHHVGPMEAVILGLFFSVGCWLGWDLISRLVFRAMHRDAVKDEFFRRAANLPETADDRNDPHEERIQTL